MKSLLIVVAVLVLSVGVVGQMIGGDNPNDPSQGLHTAAPRLPKPQLLVAQQPGKWTTAEAKIEADLTPLYGLGIFQLDKVKEVCKGRCKAEVVIRVDGTDYKMAVDEFKRRVTQPVETGTIVFETSTRSNADNWSKLGIHVSRITTGEIGTTGNESRDDGIVPLHCTVQRVTQSALILNNCSPRFNPALHLKSHNAIWTVGSQFHILEGQTGCIWLEPGRYACLRPGSTGEAVVDPDPAGLVFFSLGDTNSRGSQGGWSDTAPSSSAAIQSGSRWRFAHAQAKEKPKAKEEPVQTDTPAPGKVVKVPSEQSEQLRQLQARMEKLSTDNASLISACSNWDGKVSEFKSNVAILATRAALRAGISLDDLDNSDLVWNEKSKSFEWRMHSKPAVATAVPEKPKTNP